VSANIIRDLSNVGVVQGSVNLVEDEKRGGLITGEKKSFVKIAADT